MTGFLRQDQTVKHDPPHTYGDCFRTTIANLLGLRVSEVPHFYGDGCEYPIAQQRLNAFLRPYGLGFISVGGGLQKAFRETVGISGVWHEAGGETERGTFHASAFIDDDLQHDPHPTHAGFTKLEPEWGIFVALRPWEHIAAAQACGSTSVSPRVWSQREIDGLTSVCWHCGDVLQGLGTHCLHCPAPGDCDDADCSMCLDRRAREVTP